MPQSLTGLPETANIMIGGYVITIRNHGIRGSRSLFENIMTVVYNNSNENREILVEFEKYKVSYEAVIERCAMEIEKDTAVLVNVVFYDEDENQLLHDAWGGLLKFSKSDAGRVMAGQLIDKIRDCNNWGELYDEMQMTSKFKKEIRRRRMMSYDDTNTHHLKIGLYSETSGKK